MLTDRSYNFIGLKHTFASLWRPLKGVSFKELSPNFFMITFYHILHFQRMMEGSLWTFNIDVLLFKIVSNSYQVNQENLHFVDI